MSSLQRITLAMAGASGAPYAFTLLKQLVMANIQVSIVITPAGHMVINDETQFKLPGHPKKIAELLTDYMQAAPGQLEVYAKDDWSSPLASGSGAPKTMVVCPCSVGCLSAIAVGASNNLLERAADVVIKEQGKLILAIREMPLSAIHLQHMLSLARLGVIIMPPNPGFYFNPKCVQDLIDFVVAKILDQIGIEHQLSQRWGIAFAPEF